MSKLLLAKMQAFTVVNDYIWGCMADINALVRISIKNWEIEYIGSFPNQTVEVGLFYRVKYYNNKLFFAPAAANCIVVYDLKLDEFLELELNDDFLEDKNYNKKYKFENMEIYGSKIFFIPTTYPAIVELDTQLMTMKYITEPFVSIKKCNTYINNSNRQYFNCVFKSGHILYIGFNNADSWIEFDMKTSMYDIKTTDLMMGGIWTIVRWENSYIATSYNHEKAYFFNEYNCYEIPELISSEISNVCETEKDIFFFSKKKNNNSSVVRFDKKTKEFIFVHEMTDSVMKIEQNDKEITMLCAGGTRFAKYNCNGEFELFPYMKKLGGMLERHDETFCMSEDDMSLEDYIGLIMNI